MTKVEIEYDYSGIDRVAGIPTTGQLTAFKLLPHIWGRKKSPFFLWGVSPSKNGLIPPIETQCISVQGHVSFYILNTTPEEFVTAQRIPSRARTYLISDQNSLDRRDAKMCRATAIFGQIF